MSLEEGALLEPLSVGVHACKKGGVKVGSAVLILGAGPIGLVTLATAKAMGASKMYITDLTEYRLNIAKKMGAFKTIKVNREESDEQVIENIRMELNNELPDVTIDCSGFQQTIKVGIEVNINRLRKYQNYNNKFFDICLRLYIYIYYFKCIFVHEYILIFSQI